VLVPRVPVALASSSPYAVIEAALDRLGLTEAFRCVYSAEEEPYGKPHPGVYLTAARKLGVAPEACCAIEDSPNGVLAAKAAKMTCVAVPDRMMAGDPRFTPLLLGLGIRDLSMSASRLPRVKQRIRALDLPSAQRCAREVMEQTDSARTAALLDDFNALA